MNYHIKNEFRVLTTDELRRRGILTNALESIKRDSRLSTVSLNLACSRTLAAFSGIALLGFTTVAALMHFGALPIRSPLCSRAERESYLPHQGRGKYNAQSSALAVLILESIHMCLTRL
jgi:hypothetical protein